MHESLRDYRVLVYYGSSRRGSGVGGGGSSRPTSQIRILGARRRSSTGRGTTTAYEPVPIQPTFPDERDPLPCESIHSPSILVNDEMQRLTMYVHGRKCRGTAGGGGKHPTFVLTSRDGLNWTYVRNRSSADAVASIHTDGDNNATTSYLFDDLFYMTKPTQVGTTHYYALAKTQEDSTGSTVLVRCRIRRIPREGQDPYDEGQQLHHPPCQHSYEYERGPIVARGVRNADIMHVELQRSTTTTVTTTTTTPGTTTTITTTTTAATYTMYILYTMIGDEPERIHLGTVDIPTSWSSSSGGNGGGGGDHNNDDNNNRKAANRDDIDDGDPSWMDAGLLPGPQVLAPEQGYERGDPSGGGAGTGAWSSLDVGGASPASLSTTTTAAATANTTTDAAGPSPSGPGGCDPPRPELRDPAFLPDPPDERTNNANPRRISGTLFYAVQGGRSIAAARLVLDTMAYQKAIRYRDPSNIGPSVQEASSLVQQRSTTTATTKQTNLEKAAGGDQDPPTPSLPYGRTLITGTGRSGTFYLCKYFNMIGIRMSHDNTKDCGDQYPGADGAVSWYDAFDSGRRYGRVLHVVRDPIRVIQSRAYKHLDKTYNEGEWLYSSEISQKIGKYEDLSELRKAIDALRTDRVAAERYMYVYSLKHWVRRNSFVDRQALWRERIEILSKDAMSFWKFCMAGGFGSMCPNLNKIRQVMKSTDPKINSSYSQQRTHNTTYASSPQETKQQGVIPPNANTNETNTTIATTSRRLLADASSNSNSSIGIFRGRTTLTWNELEDIIRSSAANATGTIEKDLSYVAIAKAMGHKYGYNSFHDDGPRTASSRGGLPVDGDVDDDRTMIPDYECNFDNKRHWDCWVVSR